MWKAEGATRVDVSTKSGFGGLTPNFTVSGPARRDPAPPGVPGGAQLALLGADTDDWRSCSQYLREKYSTANPRNVVGYCLLRGFNPPTGWF